MLAANPRRIAALVAILAAGAAPCAAQASSPLGAGGERQPRLALPAGPVSVVVGVDDPASSRALLRSLGTAGSTVTPLRHLGALVVSGGRRSEVLAAIEDAGGVAYVERQFERHVHAEPADAIDPVTGRPLSWAFDAVRAAGGIAQAGGGASANPVAVVDTGVDAAQPDLVGRLLPGRDILGAGSVEDLVGHGTFVAGLISAIDGNGIGGRGVAGATPIIPVRVSTGVGITSADLAAGIVAAVDAGARVINISIGGPALSALEHSALDYARSHDVVVVASAGNSGQDGNPLEYPAAAVGGESGGWSEGLSVGATDPAGQAAVFSTHNTHVSIAAPGAGTGSCSDGVYSTIPAAPASLWPGGVCDRIFTTHGPGRYAMGQGTSFSAPMVAGAAALVRQVGPALRADQVGDVLRRSAVQTRGSGWNEYTGAGVLDITAAVALAARYDTTAPTLPLSAEESVGAVRLRASSLDQTEAGDELAAGVAMSLEYSRDGRSFAPLKAPGPAPIDERYGVSASQPLWLRASACDHNRNCVSRTLGPFTGTAPSALVGNARLHGSILALGVSRRCRAGRRVCVRLIWKAGPGTVGPVAFRAELRQGGGRLLARTAGAAPSGKRRALELRLTRAPACGRLVARLRISAGGATRVLTRRAVVRRPCA